MRTQIITARRALPSGERRRRDTAIAAALAPLVGGSVAGFVPTAGEPGGEDLFRTLTATARVLLPVLLPDGDLDWAWYEGPGGSGGSLGDGLVAGRFGLREPVGPRLGVNGVREVSLLVVPAVAVDPGGRRLGRGGGSYDRALARVAGAVPALAVVDEVVPAVPAEPHDRPVQGYVTPSGVHWCSG